MAGKKLAVSVQVFDEERNEYRTFMPGDEVPAEYAKQITNPDVWEQDQEDDLPVPGPGQFSVPDDKEVKERAKLPSEATKAKAGTSQLGASPNPPASETTKVNS